MLCSSFLSLPAHSFAHSWPRPVTVSVPNLKGIFQPCLTWFHYWFTQLILLLYFNLFLLCFSVTTVSGLLFLFRSSFSGLLSFPSLYLLTQHMFSTEPSYTLLCLLCHYLTHSVFSAITFKTVSPNRTVSKGPGSRFGSKTELLIIICLNFPSPTSTPLCIPTSYAKSSASNLPLLPVLRDGCLQLFGDPDQKNLGIHLESSYPPYLTHALSFIFCHFCFIIMSHIHSLLPIPVAIALLSQLSNWFPLLQI